MVTIEWCMGKKDGLSPIEPNANLADAYFKKAEEAWQSMHLNTIKDWKIATAYYAIYFSLYALLMKIGIKCEIHSCTIEFGRFFLKEYFNKDELDFVEDALKARMDAQYYVDMTVPDATCDAIFSSVPGFLIKCKAVLIKLNEKKIQELRKKFEKMRK